MANSLQEFKDQFAMAQSDRLAPGKNQLIHMNNAGQAPLCLAAYQTQLEWADHFARLGGHSYRQMMALQDTAYGRIARFVGCQVQELAFFQTTAAAISQVAFGLDLRPGDEILTWDQEYPSNFYPWAMAAEKSGAKLISVPSASDTSTPIARLEQAITPRTRVIATSWVQYRTGAICDLKALVALARGRGIFTAVDVIQGLGVQPFHFQNLGVDAACCGSHKWLAAGHGAGFLCLRSEHIEKIRPLSYGAMTFTGSEAEPKASDPFRKGAARYEPGGKAFTAIFALSAAMELIGRVGTETILAETERISGLLIEGLLNLGYLINSPHGGKHRGSFVNFAPSPDSPRKSVAAASSALQDAGISFATRPPGIRLSPHAYNDELDVECVLKALSQ